MCLFNKPVRLFNKLYYKVLIKQFHIKPLILRSQQTISMANSRAFDNPFPDFDSNSNYLSADGEQLNEKFQPAIVDYFTQNFKVWESHIREIRDDSVYTGKTGAALLYLKIFESRILPNSQEYLEKASSLLGGALQNVRIRVPSFMCGEVGLLATAAVLFHHSRLEDRKNQALRQLIASHSSVCDITNDTPDEVLYGRAGYLYALLFVRSRLADSERIITNQKIREVIEAILQSGVNKSVQERKERHSPLVYYWYDEAYLGAAHGYVGILYILLEARIFLKDDELIPLIKQTIDFILHNSFPTTNLPACLGDREDKLVHWCHGSPGAIHLFLKAFLIFKEPNYLSVAIAQADDIWRRGLLKKGYGLCHGVSGNAYAFLRLFQVTQDQKYLHRAVKFAEWCFGKHQCRTPDTPYSLFEGLAGTLYFMIDLLKPSSAKFPAFQLSNSSE